MAFQYSTIDMSNRLSWHKMFSLLEHITNGCQVVINHFFARQTIAWTVNKRMILGRYIPIARADHL